MKTRAMIAQITLASLIPAKMEGKKLIRKAMPEGETHSKKQILHYSIKVMRAKKESGSNDSF